MISESFWWSSIQWHRIDWWLIVISITLNRDLNQCLLIKKIQKLSTLEPKSESDWPEFVITDQSLNLKTSDESQVEILTNLNKVQPHKLHTVKFTVWSSHKPLQANSCFRFTAVCLPDTLSGRQRVRLRENWNLTVSFSVSAPPAKCGECVC